MTAPPPPPPRPRWQSCDGVTFDAMRAACSRCPTEYCLSCAQIYDCHGCAQRVCDQCVPRFVCECCEAEHCDCTARTACVHCGDEMCEGCADNAMLTCDHCGGAFCNHHEPPGFHTSLWCACGCAVTCTPRRAPTHRPRPPVVRSTPPTRVLV